MFVSYNWLKEYVDINDISAEKLADLITKSGIEVEGVETLNKGISGVVVGHVVECGQHPNADKLRVTKVDIGEEELVQIVCGAPNVAQGQTVAVAKVGAVLPGNFKIKKAKLRGEASHGMICSLSELGIDSKLVAKTYSEGIFVFPTAVTPGQDALEYLNLHDHVLELGLTPNRADCLSMLGVAYEVAAILGKDVKTPQPEITEAAEKTSDYISVSIDAKKENPYYAARIVKDVKVGPSPLWMQTRLMAAGIRPISNIVDITNYMLLEYGTPLHGFDYDRIGSKEIVVRLAKQDEEIVTLDDATRKLNDHHLVITNGKEPIAVAGVMGGATSEVQDDTTTVLIEAAYFDAQTVRQASKDLGLRSEASSRFEKGIDPKRVKAACDRAAALMAELAGGTVLEGVVEAGEVNTEATTVSVTADRINAVLGTSLTSDEVGAIFTRLQFAYKEEAGNFTVEVPTRRWDITISEDLIEEVARLFGYDEIPTTLPVGASTPGTLTEYQYKRRMMRRFMEGAGMYQAKTYALTSSEKSLQYAFNNEGLYPVTLKMPMSEERSQLRTSLIPHLLEVVHYNQSRQMEDVAIYEIGKVFLTKEENLENLPEEKERLAGAISGNWHENKWQGEKKAADFFVAKGLLEGLFAKLGIDADTVTFKQDEREGLHPGRTASIYINGTFIGCIGQVHPTEEKAYEISETYVFELDVDALIAIDVEALAYDKLPRYPSMTRDIALVVEETVQAGTLQSVIKEAGGELLKDVHLFDVYQGEHMEAGKKSLAFSLRYYNDEQTLTEEEVTKAHQVVLDALAEKAGATLRG